MKIYVKLGSKLLSIHVWLKTTAAFVRIKAFPFVSSFLICFFSSCVTRLRMAFMLRKTKTARNNILLSDRFRYIHYTIISESYSCTVNLTIDKHIGIGAT